ncbi:MAG TPA: hypothetical protein VHT02_09265 [Methylocella sp.]|nr:hypothetical protein [Methylocella sp.]
MFQLIHKNYRCLLSGPLSFPRRGADPCLGFEATSAAAANRVTVTERRRLAAFGIAARFMRDRSGGYAVMFGLMAPIVIGTLTLGIETGLWYSTQETIQGAANSSAISAAVGINAGNMNAALQADAVAASNGFVNDANGTTVTVNQPPLSGPNVATPGAVEVIVKQHQKLLFSSPLLKSPVVVQGRAVAVAGSGIPCVIPLNPSLFGPGITAALGSASFSKCAVADGLASAAPAQLVE